MFTIRHAHWGPILTWIQTKIWRRNMVYKVVGPIMTKNMCTIRQRVHVVPKVWTPCILTPNKSTGIKSLSIVHWGIWLVNFFSAVLSKYLHVNEFILPKWISKSQNIKIIIIAFPSKEIINPEWLGAIHDNSCWLISLYKSIKFCVIRKSLLSLET